MTGANGFVGPYVCEAIAQIFGRTAVTIPTARDRCDDPLLGPLAGLDITDPVAVDAAITDVNPDVIIHLAGIAAPAVANSDWKEAWRIHVSGTLNIAHAVLRRAPDCVLLSVGSGLVYGDSARSGAPMDEATLLAPMDEYASTKAAADLALGALASRGLRAIRIRPFNHTGPRQSDGFFLPNMAMQIARIEAGLQPPVIKVGNLEAERDFLHVRDVAKAYALAVRNAGSLPSGAILNIASGTAYKMRTLLDRLLATANVGIRVEQDPARMRPADLPRIVGNPGLAHRLLGWTPRYCIDEILAEVLGHCRGIVSAQR
ncbi:MAG: NAD-dependent epimerase/dehydratase family protein [Rhodoplanes sp.]|nr:NAD-dependent epimerase/dehydratase family protein [Rhodoplanes sp.]